MRQLKLGEADDEKQNGYSPNCDKLVLGQILEPHFYECFYPAPIGNQSQNGPRQKNPKESVEKEEEIATVLSMSLTA